MLKVVFAPAAVGRCGGIRHLRGLHVPHEHLAPPPPPLSSHMGVVGSFSIFKGTSPILGSGPHDPIYS